MEGWVLHAARSPFLLTEVHTQLFRAKLSCSATASELWFGFDGPLIFPGLGGATWQAGRGGRGPSEGQGVGLRGRSTS